MSTATLEKQKLGADDDPQVTSTTKSHPQRLSTSNAKILIVTTWVGMVAGGIEGSRWAVQQWLTDGMVFMHSGFLWIAPVTLGALCLTTGVGYVLFTKVRSSSHRSLAIAVWLASLVAWLNLIQLVVPQLFVLAWLLLGCGLATVTKRFVESRAEVFCRITARTLPWLIVGVICTAVIQSGVSAKREAAALSALPPAAEGAPNVLLIVLDTVRADAVRPDSKLTPQIARFAERGVQFASAKSTAPWTLPSQAGMFTGRLPHELSSDWLSRLDTTHPTLAEVLSENGWITGGFVGNTRYCSAETGLDRGFSHYEGYRTSWADCLLTTALGRHLLLGRLPTYLGICDWPARKHADEINTSFLRWIDRHSDRPFFAFVNYWDAHDPYFAPEAFQTQPPPRGKNLMLLREWWWTHKEDVSEEQVGMLRTAYEDCIRALDDQVGTLLKELEQRDVLDNTLVIITADHGEHFGDHELFLHGNSLYDAVLHVPLKVVLPHRVPEHVRVSEPVSLRGLPNTVLELLGLKTEFPGVSWTSHWNLRDQHEAVSQEHARPSVVISEIASQAGFPPCHGRSPVAAGPMQCVQQGQWKYIRDALGTEQLFDLQADPEETENLALENECQQTVQRMRQCLRAANPNGDLSPWPTVPETEGARLGPFEELLSDLNVTVASSRSTGARCPRHLFFERSLVGIVELLSQLCGTAVNDDDVRADAIREWSPFSSLEPAFDGLSSLREHSASEQLGTAVPHSVSTWVDTFAV